MQTISYKPKIILFRKVLPIFLSIDIYSVQFYRYSIVQHYSNINCTIYNYIVRSLHNIGFFGYQFFLNIYFCLQRNILPPFPYLILFRIGLKINMKRMYWQSRLAFWLELYVFIIKLYISSIRVHCGRLTIGN